MVDKDCLLVELRRLRESLRDRAEHVFALEARLVDLRSKDELRKQQDAVSVLPSASCRGQACADLCHV